VHGVVDRDEETSLPVRLEALKMVAADARWKSFQLLDWCSVVGDRDKSPEQRGQRPSVYPDCVRHCSRRIQLQRRPVSPPSPGPTKGVRRRTIRPSMACVYAGCQSGSRCPRARADGVNLVLSHPAMPLLRGLRCSTADQMAKGQQRFWRHHIEHHRIPGANELLVENTQSPILVGTESIREMLG
jgi:hypothetical protein